MADAQQNKENKIKNLITPPQPNVVQPPEIPTQELNASSGAASPLPEQVESEDPLAEFASQDPLAEFSEDPLAEFEDERDTISKLKEIKAKIEEILSKPQDQGMLGVADPLKKLYQIGSIPADVLSEELVGQVHDLQSKLHWDEPKTKSVFVNTMLNIARESPAVAAEFAGQLISPESVVALGWGAGVKAVGKSEVGKIQKEALDATIDYYTKKLPKWLTNWTGKTFGYKYGLPNKQEYVEIAEKRLRDIKGFLSSGSETGHKLYDGLSEEAQMLAKELMEGKFDADEVERISLLGGDLYKQYGIKDSAKFLENIKDARQVMDDVSEVFVKEALSAKFINEKTAETIMNNRGKYMPRLYEIFENKELREKIRSNKTSLESAIGTIEGVEDFLKNAANYTDDQVVAFAALAKKEQEKILKDLGREVTKRTSLKKPASGWFPSLLKRGDLDKAQQEARKVIKTPAYLATRHIQQSGEAATNLKFFNEISKNPNWVAKPKGVMGEDWVEIPKDRKFGDISGKWVRKEIAEDIISLNNATGTAGKMYKAVSDLNKVWKANKILFSPATHARNIMANSILLDLSGVPLWKTPALLTEATEQIIKKGPIYKEALEHNLIGSGFANKELDVFLPKVSDFTSKNIGEKVSHGWRKMYEKAGNIYASEEEVFKIAKYMHETRNGLSPLEAAAEAEKWLFNYNKVSKATAFFRDNAIYNIPFITFAVKSTPRVAEAALKNPFKLYKYSMFMDAFNNQSAQEIGMSKEDLEYIKSKKGVGVLLPQKDQNGDPMWLSLRNIIPWADYHDTLVGSKQGKSDIPPMIQPGGVTKILTDVAYNKDPFTGKEIYTGGFTQSSLQIGAKIMKDFAPPLNPIPFGPAYKGNVQSIGYQAQKLADSLYAADYLPETVATAIVAKKAGYYGAAKSVPFAVMDVFLGLSVQAVQDEIMLKMDVSDFKAGLSEAKKILSKAARDQGIDENSETGREQLRIAEDMMIENMNRLIGQWERLHP